jgi:hypothetical protein
MPAAVDEEIVWFQITVDILEPTMTEIRGGRRRDSSQVFD